MALAPTIMPVDRRIMERTGPAISGGFGRTFGQNTIQAAQPQGGLGRSFSPAVLPPTPQQGRPQMQPQIQQAQQQANLPAAPATGLIGSEQAMDRTLANVRGILGGFGGGAGAGGGGFGGSSIRIGGGGAPVDLSGAGAQALKGIESGVSALSPFASAGQEAINPLLALSGVRGSEAFNEALVDSPIQQFLREQGQRAVTSQAAAIGGLGGGNVQRELARFGQGIAGQQLQQQIENMQGIGQAGLQAAGQQAGLRGRQADIAAQLGSTQAQLNSQRELQGQSLGIQGALQSQRIAADQRSQLAQAFLGLGGQRAQGRTQAGQQIAGQVAGTSSALSNLLNQQGSGISDLLGSGSGTLGNLILGAGQQDAASFENLAATLANIATGQSTGAQTSAASFINTEGTGEAAGQAASLIGAMMSMSDIRLKENIKPIGKVGGVNLYTWDWNEKGKVIAGDQPAVGVIAQEVQITHPYAVIMDESGYLKVNYAGLH